MARYKVFVADSIAREGLAELARFPELEVVVKTGLAPRELAAAIGDAAGLVVRSATQASREVIAAGAALKVIGRAGAGVDNIDVAAATERGIVVMNTPGGNAEAAAELAVGLMFALAREIPRADASMKARTWEKKGFHGTELLGKTLGLVGFGNVGHAVARMGRGLGMAVVACDPYAKPARAAELGVRLEGLDEVLASADFLSIHSPRTPETRGMIDARAFAKMKEGVIFVNCARGGIVVESDLLAALESGKVRGAGIDVYDQEPPVDWSLAKHPRVIATPHLGATTHEAQVNVSVMIARQIGVFLTRGEAQNAVNRVATG